MNNELYLGMAFILLVMIICVMVNNCNSIEPFIEGATTDSSDSSDSTNYPWLSWATGGRGNWKTAGVKSIPTEIPKLGTDVSATDFLNGGKAMFNGKTYEIESKSPTAYYKCKNGVQINTFWNGTKWSDVRGCSKAAVVAATSGTPAASGTPATVVATPVTQAVLEKIDTEGERNNILNKLKKYKTFVPGSIRDFLNIYGTERKIRDINPDWQKKTCAATWVETGGVKCFTFVELYDASIVAEKQYKNQKQASDIRRLRAKTNRDYDRFRKIAVVKYKLDKQKQRKALEKLALYKKLIDSEDYDASFVDFDFKDIDSLMDYDFNKKVKELDDIIRKKAQAKGIKTVKTDEDKKKEEATRTATNQESSLTKKYMDSEFSKVIDRIGTVEKRIEDEAKRDALMEEERRKKEGEQLQVTQRMPEKVDIGVDTGAILDNEDKMKKFDASCKYATPDKKDYGFGADGYSYMKDKHWGEPNQQPPSNCPSNCEPAGMYASGAPLGVLNLTTVGTILPTFKYTEGGYKCPQPKRGNNKFTDIDLLSTDKGAVDASAWKGAGYRYGKEGEDDDIYYISKKEYADKMGKETGMELDRYPMSVDRSKGAYDSLSEREKTATCELCARQGSDMCITNPICKNCVECDNWKGKEQEMKEGKRKAAAAAAATAREAEATARATAAKNKADEAQRKANAGKQIISTKTNDTFVNFKEPFVNFGNNIEGFLEGALTTSWGVKGTACSDGNSMCRIQYTDLYYPKGTTKHKSGHLIIMKKDLPFMRLRDATTKTFMIKGKDGKPTPNIVTSFSQLKTGAVFTFTKSSAEITWELKNQNAMSIGFVASVDAIPANYIYGSSRSSFIKDIFLKRLGQFVSSKDYINFVKHYRKTFATNATDGKRSDAYGAQDYSNYVIATASIRRLVDSPEYVALYGKFKFTGAGSGGGWGFDRSSSVTLYRASAAKTTTSAAIQTTIKRHARVLNPKGINANKVLANTSGEEGRIHKNQNSEFNTIRFVGPNKGTPSIADTLFILKGIAEANLHTEWSTAFVSPGSVKITSQAQLITNAKKTTTAAGEKKVSDAYKRRGRLFFDEAEEKESMSAGKFEGMDRRHWKDFGQPPLSQMSAIHKLMTTNASYKSQGRVGALSKYPGPLTTDYQSQAGLDAAADLEGYYGIVFKKFWMNKLAQNNLRDLLTINQYGATEVISDLKLTLEPLVDKDGVIKITQSYLFLNAKSTTGVKPASKELVKFKKAIQDQYVVFLAANHARTFASGSSYAGPGVGGTGAGTFRAGLAIAAQKSSGQRLAALQTLITDKFKMIPGNNVDMFMKYFRLWLQNGLKSDIAQTTSSSKAKLLDNEKKLKEILATLRTPMSSTTSATAAQRKAYVSDQYALIVGRKAAMGVAIKKHDAMTSGGGTDAPYASIGAAQVVACPYYSPPQYITNSMGVRVQKRMTKDMYGVCR